MRDYNDRRLEIGDLVYFNDNSPQMFYGTKGTIIGHNTGDLRGLFPATVEFQVGSNRITKNVADDALVKIEASWEDIYQDTGWTPTEGRWNPANQGK